MNKDIVLVALTDEQMALLRRAAARLASLHGVTALEEIAEESGAIGAIYWSAVSAGRVQIVEDSELRNSVE